MDFGERSGLGPRCRGLPPWFEIAPTSASIWTWGGDKTTGVEADAILEPVDEKYLSASAASSRSIADVVPVLVV